MGGGSLWRERRQARPGEAQEPSCGAAKGGCGPYGAVAPMDGTTAVRDPYCLAPIAWPLWVAPIARDPYRYTMAHSRSVRRRAG